MTPLNSSNITMLFALLLVATTTPSGAFAPNAAHALNRIQKFPSTITTKTSSGTALDAFALDPNAISALDTFYQSQPYLSAFLTCSFKASAADLVVQKQEEENVPSNPLDIRRNLGLLLYGGLYQGMVQEYLYTHLFPQLFGEQTTIMTVAQQVGLDMIILTPFMCLPVAYLVKAMIAADQTIPDGLQRYIHHVQEEGLLLKYWALWIPVQSITFGVVPQHLRIVFVAFVSFFWLMILSNISARKQE